MWLVFPRLRPRSSSSPGSSRRGWGRLPAASRAQTKILRAEKLVSLKTVKDSMRADLRYAEIMAREHPTKLLRLGWGGRRPRPRLKPPGAGGGTALPGEGGAGGE